MTASLGLMDYPSCLIFVIVFLFSKEYYLGLNSWLETGGALGIFITLNS